jgi:hypothetical protein
MDAVSLSVVTAGVLFDLGTISTLEGANMEIDMGHRGYEGGLSHYHGICLSLWVLWSSHANCLLTGSIFSVPGRLRYSLCV